MPVIVPTPRSPHRMRFERAELFEL